MNESFLCNICADDINDLSKKIVLKCNPQHIFCYDCIYDWYFKNKGNNSASSSGNMYKYATCPICQKDGGFLTLPEGKVGIENVHFPKKMQTSYAYKPCDCVDKAHNGNYYTCHSSGSNVLSLNNPTKVINLCYIHKNVYQKGNPIIVKNENNYETIESIYGKKQCVVTLKNGAQCNGNANPQKNGNYLTIEKDGATYCVCKKHVDDFNLNKVLNIQNKNIVKNNMDDFTNLCGELLASGHLCKKVGNPKYNGKCGIHKDKTSTKENGTNSTNSTNSATNSKDPPYSKIKSDYLELYDKLNTTLSLFKNNVDKSILENKVVYLENILENINSSIKNIGYVGYAVKNEAKNEITEVQFDIKSNVDELKKGIDDFELLVNKIFKNEDDKDIFEELNQTVNESKKELKIDLYDPNFKIDSHCNVKQKNGKLCNNPANIYYNLKCYKHHNDHYLKEKLTNNDELFVIKKEKNKKEKIKNKE